MSLEQLLPRIRSLLQFSGRWHCRALDTNTWHKGDTATEAVQRALGLWSEEDW